MIIAGGSLLGPETAGRGEAYDLDYGATQAMGEAEAEGDVTVIPAAADGTDQSAIINDTLANATTSIVMLEEGEFWIATNIIIPTGKTLVGAGQSLTSLNVLPSFGPLGPPDGNNASIVVGDGAGLADLT